MGITFLRGNSRTPKGHAILVAHSAGNPRTIYSTYCIVPPIPMSIAKFLPPLFAAQIPTEELRGASSISGIPIPPMLEEGLSMTQLENLADQRADDLCDIGPISGEEMERMQIAALISQEYAQLYASYIASAPQVSPAQPNAIDEPAHLDDVDTEELLLQTMSDRQKLAELGKMVGMARYALDGHDAALLQSTRRRMERISRLLPDKYRGPEIIDVATSSGEKGARLAELYLSRAYKLLDEEYADIPAIERTIRDLQD